MVGISGHVTFQVAISASGKAVAPLVIFSKNLQRGNYSEGIRDEWNFVCSGYINSAIFLSWFQDCFVKQIGRSRPIVVIIDNHTSHLSTELIDYAKSENIELLFLPAHTTHLLQPLDVGFYHMFKTNVSNMATSLGYTGIKTIPRHKCSNLLHLALNKIGGSNISAAFSDRPLEFIPWILQRFVFPSLSLEPRRSQRPRLCLNGRRVCVSPVGLIQRTSWSNLDLLQQSSRTF